MDSLAARLVTQGLKYNTHRTYAAGQRLYVLFCNHYNLITLPASEQQLLRFIAYMHSKGLNANTIHVYLSSVSSMHLLNGFPAPPNSSYRVRLACKAIKDNSASSSKKAPITYPLLQYIVSSFAHLQMSQMWTAIVTLAFFGAMRGAEYLATITHHGTIKAPLVRHLHFLQHGSHLGIRYAIHGSKTSAQPIFKYIGCSGTHICAVCAMQSYLNHRSRNGTLHPDSYLFVNHNGQPVSKDQFNQVLKSAVSSLSLPAHQYSTHSLRSGAATTAAQLGFTEPEIKNLGHWASSAYTSYIHNTPIDNFTYAKRLVQHL